MRALSTFTLLVLASTGLAQPPGSFGQPNGLGGFGQPSGKSPFGQPNPPEKVRWEYAEITYRTTPGRAPGKGKDGNEVPAVPATTTVRWMAGETETEANGWGELAETLKAPGKKEASNQRLRVLNALGADGWELVSQTPVTSTFQMVEPGARGFGAGASTNLLFKRRVR